MGNEISPPPNTLSKRSSGQNAKEKVAKKKELPLDKLPLEAQKMIDDYLESQKQKEIATERKLRGKDEKIRDLELELQNSELKVQALELKLKLTERENESIKRAVTHTEGVEDNLFKGLSLIYLNKNSDFALKNEKKNNEKLRRRFEEIKDHQGRKDVMSLIDDLKISEKKYRVLSQRNHYNSLQVCGDLRGYLEKISRELIPFEDVESHYLFCQNSSKKLEEFGEFVTNHKKVVSLHHDLNQEMKKFGNLMPGEELGPYTRPSGGDIDSSSDSSDSEVELMDEENEGEVDERNRIPLIQQLEIYLRSYDEYCHTPNTFSSQFDKLEEKITSLYDEMKKIIEIQQNLISISEVTEFHYARHINSIFYQSQYPQITEEYKKVKKMYRAVDEFLSRLSKFENTLKKKFLEVRTNVEGLLLLEQEKFAYLKKIETNFLDGCPKQNDIPVDLIKEVKKRFSGVFSAIKKSKFQETIRTNISFNEKKYGTQFSDERYRHLTTCETWIRLTKLFRYLVSNYLHEKYEKMISVVDLALENNYISFGKLQISSVVKGNKPKKVTYYGTVKILPKKKVVVPHGMGREYYKKNMVFVGQYESGARKGKGINYYSVPRKIGMFEYFADSKYMKYTSLEDEEFGDLQNFITSETKKVLRRKVNVENEEEEEGEEEEDTKGVKRQLSSVEVEEINKSMREELEKMKERLECQICFEREKSAVLDPCGHAGLCFECASKIDLCPFCRKYIDKVVKTYGL